MALIKNRTPSLRECGKIKIGRKAAMRKSQSGAEFQPPVKLDHFLITTNEVGEDGNFVPDTELMQAIAQRTGQQADKLTSIPVTLLFNDVELNFASRYAAYQGKSLWCSGDGEAAKRMKSAQPAAWEQVACPCERIERDYPGKDKCKINGSLAVLIDGAPGIGGVWRFRTTSFNSTDALLASLVFIHRIASGKIAGIPLNLVVSPKKVADPAGKQQTIYVVGLEYAGNIADLRRAGIEIAQQEAHAKLEIETMEAQMRRMLEPKDGAVFGADDPEDVADEFFHDAQEAPAVVEPEDESGEAPEPTPAPPATEQPKAAKPAKAKLAAKAPIPAAPATPPAVTAPDDDVF